MTGENGKINTVLFNSIDEVDEHSWDLINEPASLYSTHRFLRSVEHSKVENAKFWYLMFYCGDTPVGSAALSAFDVSLDLFMGMNVQKTVKFVRKLYSRFLKVRILFCGLPVSIAKNTLTISVTGLANAILKELVSAMSQIARAEHIHYICAKEFREEETPVADNLKSYGYFRANSIPTVNLPIRWHSFNSYLGDMRHSYRRQIKINLKKFSNGTSSKGIPHKGNQYYPKISLHEKGIYSPADFHRLYMEVMERAVARMEILNAEFFSQLNQNLSNELITVSIVYNNLNIGAALLAERGDTLHFLLVGLDYSYRDKFDVYFNLIYAIIDLAIQNGYSNIDMGQTSYQPKIRVGGECTPVYFYLKIERYIPNLILKNLRNLIFPMVVPKKYNVFHNDSPG